LTHADVVKRTTEKTLAGIAETMLNGFQSLSFPILVFQKERSNTMHTKTPLRFDGVRRIFQGDEMVLTIEHPFRHTHDLGEEVVRAFNTHAALVEALELARATIERVYKPTGKFSSVQGTYDVIDAALALAKGKE
jgi:hypothetical protein